MNSATSRLVAVRLVTGLLIALGLFAVASRSYELGRFLREPESGRAELSTRERASLERAAQTLKFDREPARFREAEAEVIEFSRSFNTHPVISFLHLIPALIFLLLAPLQFSRGIRNRYRTFHRWSGRVLLVCVLAISGSALYFGLLMPFGGAGEALAVGTFGGLFLFMAARAFRAIRAGDVVRHREWMIRMFAIALGVSSARIVLPLMVAALDGRIRPAFAPSLWLGWLLTLAAAEWWIRRTRSLVPREQVTRERVAHPRVRASI